MGVRQLLGTLGLMRVRLAALLVVTAVSLGCSTVRTDVDAGLAPWRTRVADEIPVGTDIKTVMVWFERQGMHPERNPLARVDEHDLEVYLGSIPAREWYCGRWMLRAVIRVSSEGRVTAYDFHAMGDCL